MDNLTFTLDGSRDDDLVAERVLPPGGDAYSVTIAKTRSRLYLRETGSTLGVERC